MVLIFKAIFYIFFVFIGWGLSACTYCQASQKEIQCKKNVPKSVLTSCAHPKKKNQDAQGGQWLADKLSPVGSYNKKKLKPFIFKVRVLLNKVHAKGSWKFHCSQGCVITAPECSQRARYKTEDLHIVAQKSGFFVNGKKITAKNITIIPQNGIITFNQKQYPGVFNIIMENNHIYIINELDIEEYVGCVLHAESWPGWPLEVNKAFAIASRSYLVARIIDADKSKRLYHIKNTNIHQTYKGLHANPVLKQAIDDTRGLILTYNKKPIDAMFDSCCGDIIPAHINGIDFKKAPYLARGYRCTYCKPCKIYVWKIEYPVQDVEKILQAGGYPIKNIKSIKVIKKDKAGIAELIEIRGSTTLTITGRQAYSLFDTIKSWYFLVEKKGRTIIFTGRGYGHHLGLCQWGARRMIDYGKKYPAILNFYYPGTLLMQLATPA